MAFLVLLVFALGVAVLATGAVAVIGTMSFVGECADECQGGVLSFSAGLVLIGLGSLALALAITLLNQREARKVESRDRELHKLKARLLRD